MELYRQWPGYFFDSLFAAFAGAVRAVGARAWIGRAYLHDADTAEGVLVALCDRLKAQRPWSLLVVDRVWSDALLTRLVEAAAPEQVVAQQWASVAAFTAVTLRIAPASRAALVALAQGESPHAIPNVWTREESGSWRQPSRSREFLVKETFAEPLDLAYDLAETFGVPHEDTAATRYLVLNMGCPYRGAANTTGFLDGLTLDTPWGERGCTFCNVQPYERQSEKDRAGLIAGQLARLARHGSYRRLVILDEYVFRDLDAIVEAVLTHNPEPVEVLVRARVDYLFSCREPLERALTRLQGRGVLSPYLLGVENFSDAELARYNKGYSGDDAERAIGVIDELLERYPGALKITPSSGFILFGPWTTLSDLRANATAIRRTRFRRFRGGFTSSKLRLGPQAALWRRAQADGLLVDAFGRPDEGNAAATGYQAELPWRFADPQAAQVWELLNRPGTNRPLQGRSELDRLDEAIARVARGS